METVLSHQEMRIDTEDDIILTRRRVREMAEARKFDTFATSAITTAASELARNVLVLAGGYSTARSMGLGLSGSRRLVDSFDLVSAVGKGTTIRVVKWKRF